ncbi:cytochrome c biogenesis protein ResB [Pusillimonas sp. CC-YST705]|uniref:Cytochrome c biogenesis protein ResB n=2 Tax=Mesopusillimonas faecipullorum TaxID=2755040 RepID=A0ABS8CF65_9BURK|nr:cytochrome c biogenesis protein ResB [Mesopusillimonas faecipullorum]
MRFAISLLLFICVASIIGTVLAQNQLASTYVDQFGPFWFEVFDKFSIWQIYNSWWFLLIMGFLVVSTSLCLLRNAPRMIRDMGSFRETVREGSLKVFPNRVEVVSALSVPEVLAQARGWLDAHGYRAKLREDADGVMVAAKKGSANRLGYIFAHVSIVVICIGGLLDSELPVRLQVWLGGKQPVTENMLIADVPESGRLPAGNISFRGNVFLPDGSQTRHGVVSVGEGVLVQPLPFSIKLERFYIDYYSTGMPSSFKSDVEVTDLQTGDTFKQTIEVNEPLRHRGVTVYQSSFDDGGSRLWLQAWPLTGDSAVPQSLEGTVGQTSDLVLSTDGQPRKMAVDLTGLRVINVENLVPGAEPQPRAAWEHVAAVTGSAAGANNEYLRNVGPSVEYRILDEDGQAYQYHHYMLPMELDGQDVFLAGVRTSPAESYRYVRIPADANHSLTEFMHLRAALNNEAKRQAAAEAFARYNATPAQRESLTLAARGALESFARAGFNEMLERIPEQERERVLGLAVPMVQMSLFELYDLDRQSRGLPALAREGQAGEQANDWARTALLALTNLPDYPAPVFLQLQTFEQVQASVFQVTRTPGKFVVYLGCLFLIIGVFAMFYIRDRRVWIWVRADAQGSRVLAAMATQKPTLDFTREFERFREAVTRLSA